MKCRERLRLLAKFSKTEIAAYRLVTKDPRTPCPARWLLAAALGYFLFLIDAILDSIPRIGFFDDILMIGIHVWLTLSLIPKEVIEDCCKEAGC